MPRRDSGADRVKPEFLAEYRKHRGVPSCGTGIFHRPAHKAPVDLLPVAFGEKRYVKELSYPHAAVDEMLQRVKKQVGHKKRRLRGQKLRPAGGEGVRRRKNRAEITVEPRKVFRIRREKRRVNFDRQTRQRGIADDIALAGDGKTAFLHYRKNIVQPLRADEKILVPGRARVGIFPQPSAGNALHDKRCKPLFAESTVYPGKILGSF